MILSALRKFVHFDSNITDVFVQLAQSYPWISTPFYYIPKLQRLHHWSLGMDK